MKNVKQVYLVDLDWMLTTDYEWFNDATVFNYGYKKIILCDEIAVDEDNTIVATDKNESRTYYYNGVYFAEV